jgi:hypothetical protein
MRKRATQIHRERVTDQGGSIDNKNQSVRVTYEAPRRSSRAEAG